MDCRGVNFYPMIAGGRVLYLYNAQTINKELKP